MGAASCIVKLISYATSSVQKFRKVKILIDNTVENLYIKEVLSQGIYGDGVVYVRIAGNTGSHGSGRTGMPFKERRHVTHQATPLETPANRGAECRP